MALRDGSQAVLLAERLLHDIKDLIRLAAPVIVARAGIMVMAVVDTLMVGRYSSEELAYLGIGLAPTQPVLVAAIGLVMGAQVMTAHAYGAGTWDECGAVWRRGAPYAFGIGLLGALVLQFGEALLTLLGQSDDIAANGGDVVRILGYGLPFALFFVASTYFLEGIRRPVPGMVMMGIANVANVGLNWVLVYGNFGFPAMGAEGSAWATTSIRAALAVAVLAYIWYLRDRDSFAVRSAPIGAWRDWATQRRIGYAAGVSIGTESMAFGALNIFAGWLGTLTLGTFAIVMNLLSLVAMTAIGMGSATSVRVGIANGRRDPAGVALAGWSGLGVNTLVMLVFAGVFWFWPGWIAGLYSDDPTLIALAVPAIGLLAFVSVLDGGQLVMNAALRGRRETWVPTSCKVIAYFLVMLPAAWYLAVDGGRGAAGLFEAVIVASAVSLALLAGRFHWLAARDRRAA